MQGRDGTTVTETVTTVIRQDGFPNLRRGSPPKGPNTAEDHQEIKDDDSGRAVVQRVIQEYLTPAKIRKFVLKPMLLAASEGDVQAGKLLLEYSAGRPSIEQNIHVRSQSRTLAQKWDRMRVEIGSPKPLEGAPEVGEIIDAQSDVKALPDPGRTSSGGADGSTVPALSAPIYSGSIDTGGSEQGSADGVHLRTVMEVIQEAGIS